MSSENVAAVSRFIEGAPPGELTDVINDVKALTTKDPSILQKAQPALQKYHEEQLTCVKLPGSSRDVIISQYNALGNGRYYDIGQESSWTFDTATQTVTDVQPYTPATTPSELLSSITKPFSLHASEHYPNSAIAIIPSDTDSITLLLAANKYSPANFWNGRYRSIFHYAPSTSTLTGSIKVDVHYYEDGNVRLITDKAIAGTNIISAISASPSVRAGDIIKEIAKIEKKYQEELNRGFGELSENAFKGLRRQLPVTRQKMEWEKVGSYRASREIGGANHQ